MPVEFTPSGPRTVGTAEQQAGVAGGHEQSGSGKNAEQQGYSGGGSGYAYSSGASAPSYVDVSVQGGTVYVGGQGYSVRPEDQPSFIQSKVSSLGGVLSPSSRSEFAEAEMNAKVARDTAFKQEQSLIQSRTLAGQISASKIENNKMFITTPSQRGFSQQYETITKSKNPYETFMGTVSGGLQSTANFFGEKLAGKERKDESLRNKGIVSGFLPQVPFVTQGYSVGGFISKPSYQSKELIAGVASVVPETIKLGVDLISYPTTTKAQTEALMYSYPKSNIISVPTDLKSNAPGFKENPLGATYYTGGQIIGNIALGAGVAKGLSVLDTKTVKTRIPTGTKQPTASISNTLVEIQPGTKANTFEVTSKGIMRDVDPLTGKTLPRRQKIVESYSVIEKGSGKGDEGKFIIKEMTTDVSKQRYNTLIEQQPANVPDITNPSTSDYFYVSQKGFSKKGSTYSSKGIGTSTESPIDANVQIGNVMLETKRIGTFKGGFDIYSAPKKIKGFDFNFDARTIGGQKASKGLGESLSKGIDETFSKSFGRDLSYEGSSNIDRSLIKFSERSSKGDEFTGVNFKEDNPFSYVKQQGTQFSQEEVKSISDAINKALNQNLPAPKPIKGYKVETKIVKGNIAKAVSTPGGKAISYGASSSYIPNAIPFDQLPKVDSFGLFSTNKLTGFSVYDINLGGRTKGGNVFGGEDILNPKGGNGLITPSSFDMGKDLDRFKGSNNFNIPSYKSSDLFKTSDLGKNKDFTGLGSFQPYATKQPQRQPQIPIQKQPEPYPGYVPGDGYTEFAKPIKFNPKTTNGFDFIERPTSRKGFLPYVQMPSVNIPGGFSIGKMGSFKRAPIRPSFTGIVTGKIGTPSTMKLGKLDLGLSPGAIRGLPSFSSNKRKKRKKR